MTPLRNPSKPKCVYISLCARSKNATRCDTLSAQGYKTKLNYVCVVTGDHVLWLSRCGGDASQSHTVVCLS